MNQFDRRAKLLKLREDYNVLLEQAVQQHDTRGAIFVSGAIRAVNEVMLCFELDEGKK